MQYSVLTVGSVLLISAVNGLFPQTYKFNDPIPVRVSNVAPFYNPTEKYAYDGLPWPCKPSHIHSDGFNFGALINGERSRESLYQMHFQRSTNKQTVCGEKELSQKDVNSFIDAINNEYQYEMWIDDLPIFGPVGFHQTMSNDQAINIDHGGDGDNKLYFLITHRHFNVAYNKNQIIKVNISTRLQPGHYVELKKNTKLNKIHFTYSMSWSPTTKTYSERFNLFNQATKTQVEVHWLWILNSSLLVILLTGLLSMVLIRTLKNDYARYLMVDEYENDNLEKVDESGWKRVRFDVFRAPKYPYLFSSIIGIGAQILLISFFLLILAVIGYFYSGNHGRMYVAVIFLYSFTAYIAGFVASKKLKELTSGSGGDWMISCGITSALFAAPYLIIFSVVNSIAIYNESAVALPFKTILVVLLLWSFVTFPLTAFGAYRGGKSVINEYPCHVKKIPRALPTDLKWYDNDLLSVLATGLLQFLAIYVEVHTIFNCVWGHQPYQLFGILLLTFFILLIVTSSIVILLTYFQLNREDYKWCWKSLIRGGSCGIYMYLYAIYYWLYTSQMSSTALQFSIYFGYTLLMSYASALMLSAVGHWSSKWFVTKIYGSGYHD